LGILADNGGVLLRDIFKVITKNSESERGLVVLGLSNPIENVQLSVLVMIQWHLNCTKCIITEGKICHLGIYRYSPYSEHNCKTAIGGLVSKFVLFVQKFVRLEQFYIWKSVLQLVLVCFAKCAQLFSPVNRKQVHLWRRVWMFQNRNQNNFRFEHFCNFAGKFSSK